MRVLGSLLRRPTRSGHNREMMTASNVHLDPSGGVWIASESVLIFAVDPVGISQGALFSDDLTFADHVREAVARRQPREVVLLIPNREEFHADLELPLGTVLTEVGPGRLDGARFGDVVATCRETPDAFCIAPAPDRQTETSERGIRLGTFGR